MTPNGWVRRVWQWVARGNIQQISYILQMEHHLPFRLRLSWEINYYLVAIAMATGGDDNYVAMAMGIIIKCANRLKTKCWNTQSLVRQGASVHVCGF